MSEYLNRAEIIEKKLKISQIFYSDLNASNQLFGILIRSVTSSGKVISVDFEDDVPNDIKAKCIIFTSKDLPAKKTIEILKTSADIFSENIKYLGEPVGILLCDDEILAKKLVEEKKIRITVKEDFENLKEKQHSQFEIENEKTLVLKKKVKSENYDSKIFDSAKFVVTSEWKNQMQSLSTKEPNGALVVPIIENGNTKFLIHTPSQWISNLEKSLSEAIGTKKENIFIDRTNISVCNTNAILQNTLVSCQAAICAKLTKRPVKIVYSRKEQEKFIENVAEISIRHNTALDEEGKILSMDVRINVDIGESCPFCEEIAERLLISALGIYKSQNFRISSKVFSSNSAPKSVKLSAIAMHTFFAVENQLFKIADETNISPITLKKNNLNSDLEILKNLEIQKVLNSVIKPLDNYIRIENPNATKNDVWRAIPDVFLGFEPSDFERKYVAYKEKSKYTTLKQTVSPYTQNPKGIALSFAIEGNGYKNRNLKLKTNMRSDGKFVIDSLSISPANWTVWTKIINDFLKIDKSMVFLSPTIETSEENNWPDTLCENISVKTHLLRKCCEGTLKGNSEFTAELFKEEENDKKIFFSASFAACTIEIEIDPCNLEVFIKQINVAIDCGKIYNKQNAETTVRLEIQKLLPQLMKDERIICDKIEVEFIESDEEPKQIGHLMHSIIPAAFASSLSVALGRTIQKLPITKEEIYNAGEIRY